jgi:hypothetical protein
MTSCWIWLAPLVDAEQAGVAVDALDGDAAVGDAADGFRRSLFADLPTAGNPWRGRRTLMSVGRFAVLLSPGGPS